MHPFKISLVGAVALVGFFLVSGLVLTAPAIAQTQQVSGDVPQHAKLASFGVVLGLRGQSASGNGLPVKLTEDVREELVEPVFRYDGFMVSNIQIESFATIKDQNDAYRILGLVVFEDAAARRIYTEFAAYYDVTDKGVLIDWASARIRTPSQPTILWFAVDPDDLTPGSYAPPNQLTLMRLLEKHGIAKPPSADRRDVAIFAISMDRFAAGDMPVAADNAAGLEVSTFNLGGWPAALFQGQWVSANINQSRPLSLKFQDGRVISHIDSFPVRPALFQ
ncbi:hypothetical protein [Pyruvatibacter sp.]|uniref:hypothetical protein n=1 Tax=Pyruvatibacter sp. TaxID=1981328 RepID=UPI003264FE68